MENDISNLLDEFEAGKLSRRDLARRLFAISATFAATGMLSSEVEAKTKPPWQDALVEGIVNYREGTNGPEEPFNSREHRDWLFGTNNGLYGSPAEIKKAIKRVRKNPVDIDTNDAAKVKPIMTQIAGVGGINSNSATSHALYEEMRKKLDHVKFHMAEAIYVGKDGEVTPTEIKDWIVEYGTIEYFGYSNPTLKDSFRRMLEGNEEELLENSHDW